MANALDLSMCSFFISPESDDKSKWKDSVFGSFKSMSPEMDFRRVVPLVLLSILNSPLTDFPFSVVIAAF